MTILPSSLALPGQRLQESSSIHVLRRSLRMFPNNIKPPIARPAHLTLESLISILKSMHYPPMRPGLLEGCVQSAPPSQ